MTIIGDNLKLMVTGSILSEDFEHAKEIADQVSALIWDLI